MWQFIHDNVGFIEQTSTGFQVGVSWGVFFGVPLTLLGVWVCKSIARMWHKITEPAS